jgi:agmatinase
MNSFFQNKNKNTDTDTGTDINTNKDKDPSAVAVRNGQLFGLETSFEEARLVTFGIPWDVTTSYRPGTAKAPKSILEASYQLDLVSPLLDQAWTLPLHTLKPSLSWKKQSESLRIKSEKIIQALEQGLIIEEDPALLEALKEVNQGCQKLTEEAYTLTSSLLQEEKRVLMVGGDHGTSLGPLWAYSEKFPNLSVLHLDAHADLRPAYEGFTESHASIMYNVVERLPISTLVQVGIRDVSPVEIEYIQSHSHQIRSHFDWELKKDLAQGIPWVHSVRKMIEPLSSHVYVSFDIDGLDPKLCPNTGTPVPGGLEFWQVQILIEEILSSGRQIVGADLVEVAPDPNPHSHSEWDSNVGARCAFLLACAMAIPE